MKKKVLLGLGLMLLTGSLTACQGNKVENSANSVEQVQNEQQVTEETENVGEGDVDSDVLAENSLVRVHTDLILGYSINTQTFLDNTSVAGGILTWDNKSEEAMYVTSYVGDVAGFEWQNDRVDISKYQNSTDIFDLLIPCANYDLFLGDTMSYEVQELFTEEINGIEMTKFEGTITVVKEITEAVYEYPVVAYGIAANVGPVLVCCIDQSEDQSQHELWMDKIDLAVSTFKDAE